MIYRKEKGITMVKRSGFLMMELLLVIGVIVGFMSFFYMKIYIPQQMALSAKADLKNQEGIKNIIKRYIEFVANYNKSLYVEDPTTGLVSINQSDFISLVPLDGDVDYKISIKLSKTIVDLNTFMKRSLLNSNCSKVNEDNDYYNYRCYGEGEEITIIEKKQNNNISKKNDIYTNDIPVFTIKKLRKGILIGNKEFSLIDTYKKLKEDSIEKINIIKKRIVSFNKTIYTNEIGSPCSYEGGLDSWDDFNIPWVWKINSRSQGSVRTNLCGSTNKNTEIKCECSNFDTQMWSDLESNHELSTIIDDDSYKNILKNLYLPGSYRYDEVGNPITILLFAKLGNSEPTPLDDGNPPPAPRENYKVSDTLDIAEYRQGEIFARPINDGIAHFQESRASCFYD